MSLIIRNEQLDALRIPRIQEWLLEQLRSGLPETWNALGEAGANKVVADLIQKARKHGFRSEQEITDFGLVGFWLGPNFDEDPTYPWATETLRNPVMPAASKARRLKEFALMHLESEGKQ